MSYTVSDFVAQPHSWRVLFALFGIAVFGGMFVVPLYAFMTTTVAKNETARTVAANNVVNSGAMVFGALVILGATGAGLSNRRRFWLSWSCASFRRCCAIMLQRACDQERRTAAERLP